MICRTCGVSLPDGRMAEVCPQCSFGSALGMGASGAGPPEVVEGYELLSELGRGGMGVVWLAREKSLDRLVALKLIAVADPRLQQRLLREGRAAAQLRHPHIVAVHALGGVGASTYLAMEFIEGGDLGAHLQGRPLPPRTAAEIAAKLAGALAHAHAAGLLHRDVKPSNVLLDLEGEPRLADFGLAAPLEGAGDLTSPGAVAGTPAYLAPELLGGTEKARPGSDIYGLGAILYTCLTGRPPFIGASAAAVLAQLPDKDPIAPHLLQPAVPRDIETICLKCLEKSPQRRYGSALLLQADLEAFLRGDPISARPVGRVERFSRFCRRHPALAASTGIAAALLLTLAIGGPLMALRLARSQRAAVAAQLRAERAEVATVERLRDSLLARSRATRLSGRMGQRDEAIAAATQAAQIRKGLDARDEVIAALALPEIVASRTFSIKREEGDSVAFDPDNDRYVVEVSPGLLELRRLSDSSLIRAFHSQASRVWSMPVFSHDGRRVAVRNDRDEEMVWSDDRPDPLFVLSGRPYVLTGRYAGYGLPEAFSPDGRTLASSLPGGGVSFHSASDGTELRRIATATVITHLAYSDDGRWLAVGRGLRGKHGEIASLRVLKASDDSEVSTLPIEASYQTIAWSPESNRLMTGAEETRIFGVPNGERLGRISDPTALKAFFGPDGTILGTGDSGFATLWDLGRGRPLLAADLGGSPMIGVNRNGTRIAKAGESDSAKLFRLEMSGTVRTLPVRSSIERDNVFSGAVPVIDYSPDGRWLATAIWGAVQLRDAGGKIVSEAPQGTVNNQCSVLFSHDGRSLLASSVELGLVRFPIEVSEDGTARIGKGTTIDPEPMFYIVDVSRDGDRALLTSQESGTCKVVRLGGDPTVVRWALTRAAGAAFVDNDREILANSLDNEGGALLELRDAGTGALQRTLNYRHGAHVHLSRDGSWVLLGAGEEKSVLLHTSDWSPGPSLPSEVQGRGVQPAFCPDGSCVAFGEGAGVCLVRVRDGAILGHLQSPQGGTYLPGLTFSPDGSHLSLWWETGQLTLWDLHALRRELGTRGLDW